MKYQKSFLKEWLSNNGLGIGLVLILTVPAWILGNTYPIIGGPVFGILIGMIVTHFIKDKTSFQRGIIFTSKKILQYAVILLGFGLNLSVVLETGVQSLPIIVATVTTSLIIAYVLQKILNIPEKISILVGVGSSICGGSAIAATAPVIEANDEEVAQAISVIFFFNVLAALIFPTLGSFIGFSTTSGEAFGIFSGTAVNDTSSVTAAASTWDAIYNLGSATLDKAVTVKLTRTLVIIPITIFLAIKSAKNNMNNKKLNLKQIFPFFILYFIGASIITTLSVTLGIDISIFSPMKTLSKFFIVMSMCAIGLNTNIIKLVKTGGKPIVMGFSCWIGITVIGLIIQYILGIW